MSLVFDHSICAVSSLDAGMRAFGELGFTTAPGGTHPTGTHNAVVPLDVGYLEILSVYDEALARRTQRHGAICDFLATRPGGLIGYALLTDDIDTDAERLASSGLTFEGPQDAERVRPDGEVLRWRVLRPTPQPAPATLPMIVWGDQSATGSAKHRNTIFGACSISIVARSLDQVSELYAAYLGIPVGASVDRPELNARQAVLGIDGFEIRLLAPMGPGPMEQALATFGEGPIDLGLYARDPARAAEIMGVASDTVPGEALAVPRERSLGISMHILPVPSSR